MLPPRDRSIQFSLHSLERRGVAYLMMCCGYRCIGAFFAKRRCSRFDVEVDHSTGGGRLRMPPPRMSLSVHVISNCPDAGQRTTVLGIWHRRSPCGTELMSRSVHGHFIVGPWSLYSCSHRQKHTADGTQSSVACPVHLDGSLLLVALSPHVHGLEFRKRV
jgi:hypothetical protein